MVRTSKWKDFYPRARSFRGSIFVHSLVSPLSDHGKRLIEGDGVRWEVVDDLPPGWM
jgi:hypothetical protein